jgi:hypothetical protein
MQEISIRIQIASIIGSVTFLFFIGRLILKGKLREEYAIVWLVCTVVLVVFSFWRDGLRVLAELLGVFYAPSLVFLASIFAIVIFLVHLSLVVSRLQKQIKQAAQELALLKSSHPQKENG